MTALYHFWWSPESQSVRLALGYKTVVFDDQPVAYDDNETFFRLGVARAVPVLQHDDGTIETGAIPILSRIDHRWPTRPVMEGVMTAAGWEALVTWRGSMQALFARLQAPVFPAYQGIGDSAESLAACKTEISTRFGASIEELSNDRYAAFDQLKGAARLGDLAAHLARNRFYSGRISAADLLLACDLFPLQLLDGITLPLDLMYYIRRVEDVCQTSLRDGLLGTWQEPGD